MVYMTSIVMGVNYICARRVLSRPRTVPAVCTRRPLQYPHAASKPFEPTTGAALRNAVQKCLAISPKNGNCVNIPRCISTETSDYSPGQVHDVRSEEDLKKLQATGQLVVTDWFAQWCGPCKAFINQPSKKWQRNKQTFCFAKLMSRSVKILL